MSDQLDEEAELISRAWEAVRPFLIAVYGEKCSDYFAGCEICRRWRLAEELLSKSTEP